MGSEQDKKKSKSFLIKLAKVVAWILGSLVFLVVLVLILIQTSFVQNYARKKVVSYLEHKLKTKVAIGKLDVNFPTALSLQNVFFEDQSRDTLLYGGEIKANLDMVALLKNEVQIQEITLNNIVAKVKRLPPDSVFNFQFIVNAFTTDQQKISQKQDTATLKMNIDRLLVNHTRIIYKDAFTGNDMNLAIGHLDSKISTFDPYHLLFNIPEIRLQGLSGYFYQAEPLKKSIEKTVAEASAAPDNYLQFLNKEMLLEDINVVYKSEAANINSFVVIAKLQLHPKKIDLKKGIITLKDALLSNSTIEIETNSTIPKEKPKDTVITVATPPFKIISGTVTIENSHLKYDDQSLPHTAYGMDYAHLDMKDISLKATGVQYNVDTILASIQSATLKEKSGFVLHDLKTDLYMSPTGIFMSDLFIQTPGSEIRDRAYFTFNSLDAVKKDPGQLGLYIDLQSSKIMMKDLWTFAPQLKASNSSLSPNSTLYLDARVTGKVGELKLHKLLLRGLTATDINVTGTIKGLPNPKKTYVNLNILKFQSSRRDLLSFLPQTAFPQNITLPVSFAATGFIKGDMNNLYSDLAVNSTLGGAKVKGTLINISNKNQAHYDVVLNARALQLGTILQNPKLGLLTGDIKIKGTGYDPQTANATFSAIIPIVTFNNYSYKNIKANGSIADKNYTLKANVHDPNLDATVAANGIFSGKYPTIDLSAIVDSIKTRPLHFTPQPLKYHGRIKANFTNLDPDHLNGDLLITHSILVNNDDRFTIDSLKLMAENTPGNQSLTLKTEFLTAAIEGQYRLTQLADVFQQSVDPYFSLSNKKNRAKIDPYHFTLSAGAVDNPALRAFLPKMSQLKPINFTGKFASDSGWNIDVKSPRVVYDSYTVDSLTFKAGTENGSLTFNASLNKFESGASISVYATTLDGTLKNNVMDFNLGIKDRHATDKYTLSGTLSRPALNNYIFSLKPRNLLLNYQNWTVNADNKIQYQNKDFNAHNFILTQGSQQISISSIGSGSNQPLRIDFNNFNLSTLAGFVQSDSLVVDGLLNGNAIVKNIQTQPTFTTDLTINNLSVYKDTLGDLNAKVNNKIADNYHAAISLTGRGNEININGDYVVKPVNSTYDFMIDIVSLQMKSLEGFTKGGLKDSRGNLYGKVAMNGSLKNRNIDGRIYFNNTAFNISRLNNIFKVDKEAIAIINNRGIILNTFTIRDTANNAIVFDGEVNTKDFFNYTFNLKVNADNFQAINSTKRDNPLFYGKMVFSTRLSIKGTPTHPVMDGSLSVNDKTDFTVVLPQSEPGVEKREGIVRFIDVSATPEDSLFMVPYDSLKTLPLLGYDVSLNITINPQAVFNLIVDAGNGDFLRMKGTGQLTAGIDASGKITLVGSYELDEGSYNLSFNFIKRKFNIQKGSRIVWTGEPTTAQISVTAVYIANTAPLDLVQGQIVEADQNIYKQKLPFEVHLLLLGELLKPQITFDIILPPEKNYNVSKDIISTVQTKLIQLRQETGEMNKQVFALLLLNRFVSQNPFDNSSGGSLDAASFARQSVSRLLTEQLNQLTRGLIEGVDINFDLATSQDYTTGTAANRTDLNVGITKRLLSDRLTVTVGSDFELEGPMQTNQQQNNLAGNISVNYKLSKDGKYMLRAYRKNDYTGAIEGYVIETGIGFIISVDYNRFKELFSSKEQRKKKRVIRKENKEIQKADSARKAEEKKITVPSKAKENEP